MCRSASDNAGFYSTAPLEQTLLELVDFDLVNTCKPRLTVGAAHVRTSVMRYFDSRDGAIGVKHILASGALPPAFPAVRIDGELYWDGGILSNTPTEAIFDDNPRKNSLIFAVHLWNPIGEEPAHHLGGAEPPEGHPVFEPRREPHRAPAADASHAPHHQRSRASCCRTTCASSRRCANSPPMAARPPCMWCGCWRRSSRTRTTPRTSTSARPASAQRWEAGYANTVRALEQAPWESEFDPLEGVILHEDAVEVMEAAE